MPEPWNPHDPNAVAIMVRTFHVRHLPARLGQALPRVTVCVPEAAVL